MDILGIFHSGSDPSAALMRDGNIIAYIEEERLIRYKHATGQFPSRSIDYVLKTGNTTIDKIDFIAQAWDVNKYADGTIQKHFEEVNGRYPTTDADRAYQERLIGMFQPERQKSLIYQHLRKQYGDQKFPEIKFVHHHFAHACTAYFNSGFDESLVLSIDGSGEEITTSWWLGSKDKLKLLQEVKVPHSLGWYYSAFTEYLGFHAYNGEYKVMGLAAYGELDPVIKSKIDKLVWYDGKGGFETDPMLLSRGKRNFSYYFPDVLAEYMGRPPRAESSPLDQWHRNCAFAVQARLEEIVFEMVKYWKEKTGINKLSISGGVGLNVKLNGNLFISELVDDLFVYPLCSDAGSSIGAAMALQYDLVGLENKPMDNVYLGTSYSDDEIQAILDSCGIKYRIENGVEKATADLISNGKVIGWFQGRMEGGPRALGARSILADPRQIESRDKVNAVIKYRELWRPFCPSMIEEGAQRYFTKWRHAPFMVLTFQTNEIAATEAPAIVHVDNTARPQIVQKEQNPRYYDLIKEFEGITCVPALLNTSFNIKGEPIVCTPHDALRTFFSTGLDALVIGNCIVEKNN